MTPPPGTCDIRDSSDSCDKKQSFSREKNEFVTHVTHVTRPEKVGDLSNMTNFSPSLPLIGDDPKKQNSGPIPLPSFTGKTIKIRWPAGSNMPTIRDQWTRLSDGRIEATYTEDELRKCLEVYDLIREPKLK